MVCVYILYNMSVCIPFGHFSPDPCQQICVLLGGETAVRACGSVGTNHASINTSDVNKQLQFSRGKCICVCMVTCVCVADGLCNHSSTQHQTENKK